MSRSQAKAERVGLKALWADMIVRLMERQAKARAEYVKQPGYQRAKLSASVQAEAVAQAMQKRQRKAMVNFNRVRTGGMQMKGR